MPARLVALLLAVVALLAATPSRAQTTGDDELQVRRLRFAEKKKRLVASGSFTDVFDQKLLEGLDSGFATTVVLRAYLYREGATARPIAFTAVTWRVVYDLWDEVYLVQIADASGTRSQRFDSRAEALRAVTTLDELALARLGEVPVKLNHFVAVIVEVNPVSEELLAEVRRWLARPQGAPEVAGNASFFGSFVSVFVNPRVAEADRTLRFRSQPFFRTGP